LPKLSPGQIFGVSFMTLPQRRAAIVVAALFSVGTVITILSARYGLDIAISSCFHTAGGPNQGWFMAREQPWAWLYKYGERLPLALVVYAGIVWFFSFNGTISAKYQRPMLVIVLTTLIGPGLIVNCILKPAWGRPRPADTVVFGGESPYREAYRPSGPGGGKSFVCGHCASAFSTLSAGALYPYHPAVAVAVVAVGAVFSFLVGVTRICQGGHYFTDVIWSGVLVVSVILWLYYFVLKIPEHVIPGNEPRKKFK
jgi:lipid A 4'-phosphatase